MEKTEGANKNGQSRDTCNIGYTKHMTNKPWRKLKGQTRMDNPETLATLDTQNTWQINLGENWRDNPETLATLGTQSKHTKTQHNTEN